MATNEHRPQMGAVNAKKAAGPSPILPVDASIGEAYAVLVSTERGARRRLYLSLHSAQKAAERSRMRGHDAELRLVRLVAVGGGLG